jgi:hypothetical protein
VRAPHSVPPTHAATLCRRPRTPPKWPRWPPAALMPTDWRVRPHSARAARVPASPSAELASLRRSPAVCLRHERLGGRVACLRCAGELRAGLAAALADLGEAAAAAASTSGAAAVEEDFNNRLAEVQNVSGASPGVRRAGHHCCRL